MRILIATLSRNLLGGVEKYIQSMIPALLRRGHSIGLLYEYPSNDHAETIDARADGLAAWCSMELGLDAAMRAVHAWAPDAVYSQGLEDDELEHALLGSYPTTLYAHTYWGTCITARKCHSLPRISPCNRTLGASCLMFYYPRRCGGLNPRTMWQLFRVQSGRKSRLAQYQAVLVASRHMQQEYERHGVPEERLHLIPLPMDESLPIVAAARRGVLDYRVLFLGRLMDVKGADYLLKAIPIAEARLGRPLPVTIAGDGPDRGALEKLARELGIAVEFTGWVNGEQRAELMRRADLLAVPSLWPEPFGMVGVEAGRSALPAVGFEVGGIPDWLIAGETGELAPGDPPTVEGLADSIARAFADPEHYAKLSRGALEMSKRFSFQRHLAQLEPILNARTPAERPVPSIVGH